MRVRLTNAASISVAVASYQVDLGSRVSGRDPLAYWRAGQRRGGLRVRAHAEHGVRYALRYGRVLGTAPGWCAGAGACRAWRAVSVEVQARAGHGIGVVAGADACWARH